MLLPELAAYLASQSLGTVGSTLFLGKMPDSPNACTALYETGGAGPTVCFDESAIAFEEPALQVISRGAADDYSTPRLTIERIYQHFATKGAFTSTARYLNVQPLHAPRFLSRDDKQRVSFVCNFLVTKEASATS